MTLAAVAALVFSACAKIETIENTKEQTPVLFGAYTGLQETKATSVTDYGVIDNLAALKATTHGFGVFACHSDASTITAATYAEFTPNFMYNQKVTWNSGETVWEYNPLKYWPNNDAAHSNGATETDVLSFCGYAPHVATNAVQATGEGIKAFSTNSATGAPTITFKVPAAEDEQIDLMYADVTSLANLTKQNISGTVTLPFKHALANLTLKVVNIKDATAIPDTDPADHVDASETSIVVNSITLNSSTVYNQGTLNLVTGAWTGTSAEAISLSKTAMDEDVTAAISKASADEVMAAMVIPGASATVSVTIDYTVTTTDSELVGGKSVVNNVITKETAAFTMLQGKRYVLYLGLGMTSVKFEASVENWTDGTNPDPIWLPINNS